MIKIKDYEVPNQADEMTVEQFDKMNEIIKNEELDNIEKWLAVFEMFGVPEETFDDYDFKDFKELIVQFNATTNNLEKITSLEIDGYTYQAPERIGVKDLGMIEKAWKSDSKTFASETAALIFKRTDLSKVEHYAPAHIKQKAKLLKDQKASIVIPYILEVLEKLTESTKQLKDEVAKELESTEG